MATPAFPPTPQGPPKPNPVGAAVSGGGGNQLAQMVPQVKAGIQAIMVFSKAIRQAKPEAADQFDQGLAAIMNGIKTLTGGGQPGPTAPQGAVPPPPQMAAESPEQTPEAT